MRDYSQGKIYCLRSHKTDLIYIGSTIQPLSIRIGKHRDSYKRYLKTGKSNEYSYKIFELDDKPYIELIKNYPCSYLDELRREEGKFIRSMECVNKRVEGRTQKEYYEDNKDQIKEYYKEWYEDNKDQILKQQKEYRQDNKEKIRERKKQKITCICGSIFRKDDKTQHERSNKHILYIESLESCD